MHKPLTDAQQSVFAAIVNHWHQFNESPSLKELSEATGLAISTLHYHMKRLSQSKVVRYVPGRTRSIKVIWRRG